MNLAAWCFQASLRSVLTQFAAPSICPAIQVVPPSLHSALEAFASGRKKEERSCFCLNSTTGSFARMKKTRRTSGWPCKEDKSSRVAAVPAGWRNPAEPLIKRPDSEWLCLSINRVVNPEVLFRTVALKPPTEHCEQMRIRPFQVANDPMWSRCEGFSCKAGELSGLWRFAMSLYWLLW